MPVFPPLRTAFLCGVFFQHMVWYGPTSETAWMQRRQKNRLKYSPYRFYGAEENNQ